MAAHPITETMPLTRDGNGRYRIGDTQVLLDLVVYAYQQGHTPETIIDQYPTLALEDVYLTLGYYLRHREELDVYLQHEAALAEQNRQADLAQQPTPLTRDVLLARLAARRQQDGKH